MFPKKRDMLKQRGYIIIFFSAHTLDLSDMIIWGRQTFSSSCWEKNLIIFSSNHNFKMLVKVSISTVIIILCNLLCKKLIFLRLGERLNWDPPPQISSLLIHCRFLSTFIMYFWIIFVIVNYDYQDLKICKFIKM